jgi:hypothetical protein
MYVIADKKKLIFNDDSNHASGLYDSLGQLVNPGKTFEVCATNIKGTYKDVKAFNDDGTDYEPE